MTTNELSKSAESVFSLRAALASNPMDMPFILRQIRLCRSTLGAILEELESGDQSPRAVERFGECATSVAAEIERLWETVKRSN